MPHAVIAGDISLPDVHRALEPMQQRDGASVHKIGESYLSRSGRRLLVEAVVVEAAPVVTSRRLLLAVDVREGGVTVRVCPHTDTEKTEGVRRTVALLAARVLELAGPGSRVERTNLGPFLEAAS